MRVHSGTRVVPVIVAFGRVAEVHLAKKVVRRNALESIDDTSDVSVDSNSLYTPKSKKKR